MNIEVTKNFSFYLDGKRLSIDKTAYLKGINRNTLASRIINQRRFNLFDVDSLFAERLEAGPLSKTMKDRRADVSVDLAGDATIKGKRVEVYRPLLIKVDGEIKSTTECALMFRLVKTTLIYRLNKLMSEEGGVSVEECFFSGKLKTGAAKRNKKTGAKIPRTSIPDPQMKIPQVALSNKWLRVAI